MNEYEALFQTICSNPEDTTLRLVLADWLEEHGQPERAEFIRAQCHRETLPQWEWERQELKWREQSLLAEHGAAWRAELPQPESTQWGSFRYRWGEFERGFVEFLEVVDHTLTERDVRQLVEKVPLRSMGVHSDDERDWTGSFPNVTRLKCDHRTLANWRKWFPNLREVEFSGDYMQAEETEWLAPLSTIPKIRCQREGGVVLVRHMLEHGWGKNLAQLHLIDSYLYHDYESQERLTADEIADLIASPVVRNLDSLHISGADLSSLPIREFFTSERLSNLRELSLKNNGFQLDNGLEVDDAACKFQLDLLDLGGNSIGEAIGRLLSLGGVAELKILGLSECELELNALKMLTESPCWNTLRVLDLGRNALGAEGMEVLARARCPEQLHTLLLDDCDLGAAGTPILASITWLKQIRSLSLFRNKLTDLELEVMAKSNNIRPRSLNLGENIITPEAFKGLAKLGAEMVALDLGRNNVDARCLKEFIKFVDSFPVLMELSLTSNNVGSEGIKILTGERIFPALARIMFSGFIGVAHKEAEKAIRAAHPHIEVDFGHRL